MEPTYLESIRAYSSYYDSNLRQQQENENLDFNVLQANLNNFLPKNQTSNFQNFYNELLKNLFLGSYDKSRSDIIENTNIRDIHGVLTEKKPYIFCSIHMGSNRILSRLFAKNNINQALLVSHQYATEQDKSEIDDFQKQYGTQLELIDVEERTSTIRLLRKLKENTSLFAFIDGNKGINDFRNIDKDKVIKINFLGKKIYVRKGLAFISHVSNVPIVPIITYRDSELMNNIIVFKPIVPDQSQSRDEYTSQAIQQIYDTFTPYIEQYPVQWEAWRYLHETIAFDPEPQLRESNKNLDKYFNQYDFSLCKFGSSAVILNNKSYQVYEVATQLYGYLKKNQSSIIRKEKIGEENYEKLIEYGIIN